MIIARYQTGWFADPNDKNKTATKVHIVDGGQPICGAQIHIASEFQWCSNGVEPKYVECRQCRKKMEGLP